MVKIKTQLTRNATFLILIVLTTGCFQAAGNGLPSAAIAEDIATFTPPPPPATATPNIQPSNTPVSQPSATPLPPTEDKGAAQVAVISSPSPLPQPSSTPQPPPTLLPFVTNTPQVIAQAATPDPNTLGTGGNVVAQANTGAQQVPTATATPLDELSRNATQRVADATQTRAAEFTQTAVGAGFQPNITPTLNQFVGPTLAPTFTPVPVATGDCIHQVRDTDRNLYRISLAYDVRVNDIAQASGIVNPELITVGQLLTIPGCGNQVASLSPPVATPAGQTTGATNNAQPAVGGRTYIVQQGDSLFEISMRFGVPISSIAAANGITNIDLIFINQELIIPAS
ncbi:MAG: LysM domain-containing protein [Chloroflexi bacterium]|nr:MAG: hypothetical protein CUN54_06665 [Phototrophicales bacterium]RMF80488.1 MAG: LysM domain-containing protein [Chloroflexota bacterium]